MTTTAQLLRTFEELAVSMRANAAAIEELSRSQGIPLSSFQTTIDSLQTQADLADSAALAIRNGDAVSVDEL
jgi:hypothetical protein